MLSNNYYSLLREYREKKRIYHQMDIEDKIAFMNLDLKLNGISIKDASIRFHTKSEAKANKRIKAIKIKK